MFAVAFTVLYAVLVVRNRWLFSMVVHEGGDFAANSIITYQAKHFDLLVGNYSRIGFSHPGPGFFYVQAFGEWLLHDLLHVVPSPWNGQALAVLALNSALVAVTLAILSRWFRSWPVLGVVAAVMLGYLAANGNVVSAIWMPFMYFPPFLLLLTAATAVATGDTKYLWALALAGSLLVHGHVSFLMFVPVIAGAALIALGYRHRRSRLAVCGASPGAWTFGRRRSGPRNFLQHPRDWLLAFGIIGLFLLPMVLNLVLHWPGEFRDYVAYGRSDSAGGHPVAEAARFTLLFWPGRDGYLWPGQPGPRLPGGASASLYLTLALFAALGALAWSHRRQTVGRFLAAGTALAALATSLVMVYAIRGIDRLTEEYTAYFFYAVPLFVLTLVVGGSAAALDRTRGAGYRAAGPTLAAALMVAALVATVASPTLRTKPEHITNIPKALDAIRDRTGGNPALLESTQHEAWVMTVALVVAGQRDGQRICVADPFWTFMMTAEFTCDERELRVGQRFAVSVAGQQPAGSLVLADFSVLPGPAPHIPATVLSTSDS